MKSANGVIERARKNGRSMARKGSRKLEEAHDLYGQVQERAIQGARYADEAVRDYPWIAVGVAAACGFWAGLCLNSLVRDRTNNWSYEDA